VGLPIVSSEILFTPDFQYAKPHSHERLKQRLPALIRQSLKDNRGTYGTPRITDDLKKLGETAGRHKVASIMRKNGIVGLPPKNFRKTTDSGHQMPVYERLYIENTAMAV
jgi:transposase InsO family protein